MRRIVNLVGTASLVLTAQQICAQSSLKADKQETKFFYAQMNLHAGFMSDADGTTWGLPGRGSSNHVALTWFNKNQKTMQRGYIKSISPVSSKLQLTMPWSTSLSDGTRTSTLKLNVADAWVKFGTKYDRTSITIGQKSVPYGHNPKLDNINSFMTNVSSMDVGFGRDLGVFLKTPVSQKLDLEFSVTSGGLLNQPFLQYTHETTTVTTTEEVTTVNGGPGGGNPENPNNVTTQTVVSETEQSTSAFGPGSFAYDGNFLLTGRIGNQTFNTNEFGLIGVLGRVENPLLDGDYINISRLGVDWIYKKGNRLKFSNQLSFGRTDSDEEGAFSTVNFQSGADFYFSEKFFFGTSLALSHNQGIGSSLYHSNTTFANSLTYAFSPHTRLRMNFYRAFTAETDDSQTGVSLQFVTGLGKRN